MALVSGVDMIPVTSSNLSAIGYDPERRLLVVQFKKSTYEYYGVPQHVFDGLLNAGSHGKYHRAHILGRYGYRQVG